MWGESVLTAGVSHSPGPVMAAVSAVPAGRLANRVGQRFLAGPGCLMFAAGSAWWLWQLDEQSNYAGAMLPGLIATGIGVGLTLPSLASAAASSLPAARFATGSAVLTMSRQLGSVLGIAVFVAVLGSPAATEAVDAFGNGYLFMIIAAVLGAVAALGIGAVQLPTAAPARVA